MSGRRNQDIKDDAGKMQGGLFLFSAVVVIIGSIFILRWWNAIPSWGKVAAVVLGILILGGGWLLDSSASDWPKLGNDERSGQEDGEG